MRFSLPIVACLVGLAAANFDLYAGDDNAVGADPYPMWQIFEAEPDCRDVYNTEMNPDLDDVSGNKRGVRCEGRGCHRNEVDNVDVVEMHFSNSPLFHFTIYKDRGHPYKMFGLDGKTYGECIMFPGDDFWCPNAFGGLRSGVRFFRCLTRFTAAEINRAN